MTQFKVDFNDFKRRDNTNLMEITLYKDNGEQIVPNRDHQWSGKALKFGDGDKRLDQELAVTIDGDKIGVPSKQLENLPSGDYGLELWEVNNDSKTIYPSAGFVEFHIHRNADESLESVTPTIDIDKVIDDLHQAGLNVVVDGIEMLAPDATPSVTSEVRDGKNHIKLHIPRSLKGETGPAPTLKIGTVTKLNPDQTPTANFNGDNGTYTLDLGIPQGHDGETGTVDNDGLINAPAFQSLQTQVNDSAVGTNLLTGTSNVLKTVANVTGWRTGLPTFYPVKALEANQTYTASCYLEPMKHDAAIYMYVANHNVSGTVVTAGSKGISTLTVTLTPEDAQSANGVWASFTSSQTDNSAISFKGFKLEKGSVATDWSPNPSEILTQGDYAKIKAAIVALGGSLS